MSLRAPLFYQIPEQTVQVTRAAFPKGNPYMRIRDHYEVLQAARERQKTELFKTQYAARAGIEGTISQGTQLGGLRRSRYRGLVKTRLLFLLLSAALSFIRVAAWLAETLRAHTRQSVFGRITPVSG